jgi:CRISPR-associated endonuclease/helicase Cas3
MPWLNVDIRVLNKRLSDAKYWEVIFGHNEYGKLSVNLKFRGEVYPYSFYVIHPDYAKYEEELGLILGKKGSALNPTETGMQYEPLQSYSYIEETWIEHSRKCLLAFQKLKGKEIHSLRLLASIMDLNLNMVEGLLALGIALHDIGKLNVEWQKSIGIHENSVPLAHTITERRVPPHATISADALYPIFKSLIPNEYLALAFKYAIAHHHHTRARKIPPYKLGWISYYESVVREVCREYGLYVVPAEIRVAETMYKNLETGMFNIEALKSYTAYCLIARIIRLSDRESFLMNNGNLFKTN